MSFFVHFSGVSIRTLIGAGILFWLFSGCTTSEDRALSQEEYIQAVSDFHVSLAASQTDEARFAFNKMNEVAVAYPKEAAAWANLGVYAMRQGNFDLAAERIETAVELEPGHADILYMAGLIESGRGHLEEAVSYFRRATYSDPDHLRVRFSLARELERLDDTIHQEEIRTILQNLLTLRPKNQMLLIEFARNQIKAGDTQGALQTVETLSASGTQFTEEHERYFDSIAEFVRDGDAASAILELSFLQSSLSETALFQNDQLELSLPPTELGFLITEFLYLETPEVRVAEPDLELTFFRNRTEMPEKPVVWLKGVTLLEELPPFPIAVSEGEIIIDDSTRLHFPGTTDSLLPHHSVIEADYNNDFRNDLVAVGNEGFRLYELQDDRTFSDVTEQLGLSRRVIDGSYHGVYTFDVDMDGDLDLLLTGSGQPLILRNNGDGTFNEVSAFPESEDVLQFLWADLNDDGAPEATLLTSGGELYVYINERGGNFSEGVRIAENIQAVSAGDMNVDARFELVTVNSEGVVQLHHFSDATGESVTETLYTLSTLPAEGRAQKVLIADVDNNGGLDILYSDRDGAELWLGAGDLSYLPHPFRMDEGVITDLLDVEGSERLDFLMIGEDGLPYWLENSGTKNYHAHSIRARASGDSGDNRINSFGIGGEMEIRAGLLYQKQLITSPIVHFGLGNYSEVDMLRIIWPNGSVQAEFTELGMGETIFNEQILKGSCPWLFTNNGEEIQFVTDALWRSPLGLRINAQETAGVVQTFDRVRIAPDQLKETDGVYDLRMTAELWETHFFDYVELIAVDHPAGTEIYIDERFVFPAPDLSAQIVKRPRPVKRVTGDQGEDMTEIVSEKNSSYISPFTKTAYQGLVNEHSVTIELQESETDAEWLILSGWLRPTDSSINLALSQGTIPPPDGLTVEVRSAGGSWKTLHDDYGFPAGKLKTILLDLESIFDENERREIRLTTTSEIYWDSILQAEKESPDRMTEFTLEPVKMDLRFRGYSLWSRADSTSPKLPDYNEISGTTQRWRDLEGFHTRFGDVSELLEEIDDRYVIMNAGDEMVLHFDAAAPPAEGYLRSFIFVSDGWVKDGDYNTEASATVLPLPYHGMADYEYGAGNSLEEDPVYQRFREDWINYHTRYIVPYSFRTALLPDPRYAGNSREEL